MKVVGITTSKKNTFYITIKSLTSSCSTPIWTMTERTKNSSAAITPWNIHKWAFLLFAVQKYDKFFEQPNFGA